MHVMKDYKQIDWASVEEAIRFTIGGMKFKNMWTGHMVMIIEGKKIIWF